MFTSFQSQYLVFGKWFEVLEVLDFAGWDAPGMSNELVFGFEHLVASVAVWFPAVVFVEVISGHK